MASHKESFPMLRAGTLRHVAILIALPMSLACSEPQDGGSKVSGADYGITNDSYRYDIPNALSQNGSIVANWEYGSGFAQPDSAGVGDPSRLDPAEQAKLQNMLATSNQEWAGTLAGQSGWNHQGPVSIDNRDGAGGCSMNGTGYVCTPGSGQMNVVIDNSVSRSSVDSTSSTMTLGSDVFDNDPQRGLTVKPEAQALIRHEMGHLYGLADTYVDNPQTGYSEPRQGQPVATMQDTWVADGLTQDDRDGAVAAWDYRNYGEIPCYEAARAPNGEDMYCSTAPAASGGGQPAGYQSYGP